MAISCVALKNTMMTATIATPLSAMFMGTSARRLGRASKTPEVQKEQGQRRGLSIGIDAALEFAGPVGRVRSLFVRRLCGCGLYGHSLCGHARPYGFSFIP